MRQVLKKLFFPGGNMPRRVLFGKGRGITIDLDPSTNLQRMFGLAECEIASEFARLAGNATTFCDIGASDGWYSILARRIKPSLQVIAFEPDTRLGQIAHRNLGYNSLTLDARFRWHSERCGSGSHEMTLDNALLGAPEPFFIKVDIEGGELDALLSGNHVLSSRSCSLIVETHREDLEGDCANWLRQRGYQVRIVPQAWFRSVIPELRPIAHNQWLIAER